MDNTLLTVPAGGSNNVILTVTIPDNAQYGVWDNIWARAISLTDNTVENRDNCRGRAILPDVEISISPSKNSGSLGGILTYEVTVKNTSGGLDDYTLESSDNSGWALSLDNTLLTVPPGENGATTLRVTIPENVPLNVWDNITITAASQADNTVENSASCMARAVIGVLPRLQISAMGALLTYTVTFCNASENIDNYALMTADKYGWNMWFENNFFEGVHPGENRRTKLMVLVCGGEDEIRITASGTYASASSIVGATLPVPETIINGSYTAYDIDDTDGPPWMWYGPSKAFQYPPIMVTQRVGSGGVVTGCSATCRNGWWRSGEWDVLLDKAFQWMKPGATKVLWYEGHHVYNTKALCSDLATALGNSGYMIDSTTTQPITSDLLAPYDILIIAQMEEGTKGTGGDPNTISDAEVQAIKSFVESGNGLLIMEGADYNPAWGYNYNLVQNKILKGLNFTVYFQNDTVYDIGWTSGRVPAKVNDNTWIGSAYENATGKDNILLYDVCSMAPKAPEGIFAGIVPEEDYVSPGENANFLITLVNTYPTDIYALKVEDDRGWSLRLDPTANVYDLGLDNTFEIELNKSVVTTLRVHIPENTTQRIGDHITVTATSITDNRISGSASCTAYAAISRDVGVSVSPEEKLGLPGENLSFTVNVKNWGTEADNYDLTVESTKNWGWSLPSSVGPLAGGEDTDVTLNVSIPGDAKLSDNDVLTITATSQGDNTKSDSASCTVCVALAEWGVRVGILPKENVGKPGENVGFTVTVTNIGKHADNYTLIFTDSAYWPHSIATTGVSLDALEENAAKLNVTIPLTAISGAMDNIRIRAISTSGNASDNDTCIARVVGENIPPLPRRGVQVSISPENQTGLPEETLDFTVTVTNTGENLDTYGLTVSDDAGWGARLDENLLTIPAGDNTTVTVSVTVPSDAIEGDSTMITVTARSQENAQVQSSAMCTAAATAQAVVGGVSPWVYVGAAIVIVIIIAVLLIVIKPF